MKRGHMISLVRNKPYLFRWRDHFSTEGFFESGNVDVEEEVVFNSVGFFVKEDKNYYHFARTMGVDMYADMMSVLKSNTLEVHPL